ncbi:helix-turn-helix domain-containing protein [Pseudarthrobacter psychrotolerans]|uniref:Helix-turn-helix domain-containing protein n=1 Tax=Pseudarthrobacter psychrotolerans TaxID=2697569 RepID=A0A6P1NGG0_9MICC|nr:helix-turn-helix domain-containing protein [Pseudarthrobacter psychrotolerans]QHK19725.1 helix-turn-helix domain-containing protein [Pseudarthrobacter psychrotolerans]
MEQRGTDLRPVLLTLDEVATVLRKSPSQLRWLIHNGKAPRSAKIGGRRMWREADVLAWIDAQFRDAA